MSYLRGDLKQVVQQAAVWVQTKAQEELDNQLRQGNGPQYTAVVDGSKSKAIDDAQRKVVIYFISAVLTRTLGRAKQVLQRLILKTTRKRTGLLSEAWVWYFQKGGKSGTLTMLGYNLSTDLRVNQGDALILAPSAGYAWFANYYAKHAGAHTIKRRRPRKNAGVYADGGALGVARSMGFMAMAARQLRPDLKKIGFNVVASWTEHSPPGPSMRWGTKRIPILVFKASGRLNVAG